MTARVLVGTRDMPRMDWLKWRRCGLGGSDAAAVLGLDPFASPFSVWLDKTGLLDPSDADGENEGMRWGRLLEDVVAREYATQTGLRVSRRHAILQHPEHPWMLADVDRFLHGRPDTGPGVLEVKTAHEHAQGWDDGSVPDRAVLQVQHYLAVTGLGWAAIAVLAGGRRFRHHLVERDQALIDTLTAEEGRWWDTHVVGGRAPEADGAAATTRALAALHPAAEPGSAVDLPDGAADLLLDRADAAAAEKLYADRKKTCDNRLRALLGDAEVGLIGGAPAVTWKSVPEVEVPATVRRAHRRLHFPRHKDPT